jgi:hypothetical protein
VIALNQFAILFEGQVPMGGLTHSSLTQNPVKGPYSASHLRASK